jgi:hypothetical protein
VETPIVEQAKEDEQPAENTETQEEKTEITDSDIQIFQTLIEKIKNGGKLNIRDLMSVKDCDVCKCKDGEFPIYISPEIMTRESVIKPFHGGKPNKGGYKDKHGGFQKRSSNYESRKPYNKPPHMAKKNSHHNNKGGFSRNPVSEDTIRMRNEADKWKNHLDTADTEDVEKQAKILLNKVTPDNVKKLRDKIKDVLMSCKTHEDRHKFIKVFFKKATHEDKYCSLYVNLIRHIGAKEMENINEGMDGDLTMEPDTPGTSKSKKKSKLAKESPFKKDLTDYCKEVLDEFSHDKSFDDIPTEDRDDYIYKYKKRLFGNLKFIAELYNKNLLSVRIAFYVLEILTGMREGYKFNDFTVEGACTFLTRVGAKMDKKIKIDELEAVNELQKADKLKDVQNKFEIVMEVLKNFQADETVDNRVKILIKNTLELRENEWIQNIQDEGPKTKKQIKKDHMNELHGIVDESPRKRGSVKNGKKIPSQQNTRFPELSLDKLTSSTTQISEAYEGESDKEEEKVPKNYSPRELEHMDHEAIKDRFIGNFVEWTKNDTFELTLFSKPENRCSKGKIVCMLLEKLYDKPEEEMSKFNDYFFGLYQHKLFAKKDIEKGISSFFEIIPNIESDFPHLPRLFSELLYFIFIEKNIADFSKVDIKLIGDTEDLEEDEEPLYFIDIYFKILGALLSKVEKDLGADKIDHYYEHFKINSTVDLLRPYVSDTDIFSEIKEEFIASDKVLKLLKSDQE